MAALAVFAERLERRFGGTPVLASVDLTVAAGEIVALLGANGAGKTTLLRVLATLIQPSGGRLLLFGEEARTRAPALMGRLAYVGHESSCYPDLTGPENLWFFARIFGLPAAEASRRVEELLAWAGLDGVTHRPVRYYSRGMEQRLALARALLHHPDLVLLDEPWTGLDPPAAALLDDRVAALGAAGRSVVLTTHDVGRVARIATRAAILERGRIAWSGPATEDGALARAYQTVTGGRA